MKPEEIVYNITTAAPTAPRVSDMSGKNFAFKYQMSFDEANAIVKHLSTQLRALKWIKEALKQSQNGELKASHGYAGERLLKEAGYE